MKSRLKSTKKKKKVSVADSILKLLNYTVFVRPQRVWLDLGDPHVNGVFGSEKLGMPAGKMYHIAGKKHVAKSAISAFFAGLSQRQHNAFVIWIDLENSYDRPWMRHLGMNTNSNSFYLVYPKVLKRIKDKKKGKKTLKAGVPFLQAAESLFDEAEKVMIWVKEHDPERPIFLVVDSIANVQTAMKVDAGPENQNMRTALDRAAFLSDHLPRLVALGKNYTMWTMLINQIRTRQGVVFGNPEYSPGGNAMDHNSHVMVNMRRKGTGLEGEGQNVAIGGYMVNEKNKAGGGSEQSRLCTYKVNLRRPYDKMWKFGAMKKKKKKVEATPNG